MFFWAHTCVLQSAGKVLDKDGVIVPTQLLCLSISPQGYLKAVEEMQIT